ncbi:hypothetical protein [Novosphingobium lindaniclasticum]|nr:hypothetical protein [Novosphingobium lindaniclasticum]
MTAAAAMLCACAGVAYAKAKVAGNEVSVTVDDEPDTQQAYELAGAHCAKFGKLAKRIGGGGYTYIFECVPRQP